MAWINNKKAYDMLPQSKIIRCLKIYKYTLNHKVYREKKRETRSVDLTAKDKILAEVKIKRGVLHEHPPSPFQFVKVMLLLNHILRKYTDVYRLTKSQENMNHLLYMDDIKLFAMDNIDGWWERDRNIRFNAVTWWWWWWWWWLYQSKNR